MYITTTKNDKNQKYSFLFESQHEKLLYQHKVCYYGTAKLEQMYWSNTFGMLLLPRLQCCYMLYYYTGCIKNLAKFSTVHVCSFQRLVCKNIVFFKSENLKMQ